MKLENIPTCSQVWESLKAISEPTVMRFALSEHSLTGYKERCLFLHFPEASQFAAHWAKRIEGKIRIEKGIFGGYCVHVPVQKPSY